MDLPGCFLEQNLTDREIGLSLASCLSLKPHTQCDPYRYRVHQGSNTAADLHHTIWFRCKTPQVPPLRQQTFVRCSGTHFHNLHQILPAFVQSRYCRCSKSLRPRYGRSQLARAGRRTDRRATRCVSRASHQARQRKAAVGTVYCGAQMMAQSDNRTSRRAAAAASPRCMYAAQSSPDHSSIRFFFDHE